MHHDIQQTLGFLGFLTLGLLGGFGHCVGMCSPFVLFVSRRYAHERPSPGRRPVFVAQAWYTAGRVVTYAALGAAAGAVGGAMQLAGALVGIRRGALLVAGGVLVIWALVALSDLAWFRVGEGLFSKVAGVLKGRVPGHPFATGLFLGLLPCGFLYSAVVAGVGLGSALQGAAGLALFGLGTAPALFGVAAADEWLGRRRPLVNRLAQVFILVMGAWFLWRGI